MKIHTDNTTDGYIAPLVEIYSMTVEAGFSLTLESPEYDGEL